jgi:hypothetical protein
MSIWDDIGDVADDVVEGIENVADGLADAAESLFEGAAPLAGILVSGAAIFIAGPTYVVPAFLAGAGGAALLIRHRPMSHDERVFAEAVYGNTLPSNDRIVLTNLSGLGGAKFVVPSVNGRILVNLGPTCYDHPLTYTDDHYPGEGKVFIHELAHVWQIHHDRYLPRVCERIAGEVTGADYKPPANLQSPWPALSLEQEATVLDEWFSPSTRGPDAALLLGRMNLAHPYFPYINEVVRKGDIPERVNGFDVFGAIVVKWRRLGGAAGFLGAPTSNEVPTHDGHGRLQRFVGGVIAWHRDVGAFSVRGAVLHRWLAIGDTRFGYPTTDELATPDGIGRFNHFRQPGVNGTPESSIYWTAGTGAVEVYGAIRAHWARLGWERSALSYPLSPEEDEGPDRKQRFSGGTLVWRRDNHAVDTLPPQPFIGVFANVRVDAPTWLYTIGDDGDLTWRTLDAATAGAAGVWRGPRTCGNGWSSFRHVVPGGGAAIYAVTQDGGLRWYRHDGFNDGSFTWTGGHEVNTGWHIFERLIGGGNGVLYGITADGTLRWYKDAGYLQGSSPATVAGGAIVGSGWTMYSHVFSVGDGVLYGIDAAGDLYWYRHNGFANGSVSWHGRIKVGFGWGDFASVFGAGGGLVFALTRDGRLLRYRHTAWSTGGTVETWSGPTEVGNNLRNATRIFAVIPSSEPPIVR